MQNYRKYFNIYSVSCCLLLSYDGIYIHRLTEEAVLVGIFSSHQWTIQYLSKQIHSFCLEFKYQSIFLCTMK